MIDDAALEKDEFSPSDVLKERYEIRKFLGGGAVGNIYLAHDRNLKIKVALKFLNKEYASDKRVTERFKTEAEIGALLNHDNINRVYNIERIGGRHCIAMDFVKGVKPEESGKTLEQIIDKTGLFEPKEAWEIIEPVLRGLIYAHNYTNEEKGIEGIIHRDINPTNIMIAGDGTVKIMDLGIAKILLKEGTKEQRMKTMEDAILGTAQYTSPEQLKALKITGKTDVFSTAVILYEMLTGRLPFDNHKIMDIEEARKNIINKKLIKLRRINSRITAKLENILLKALDKNPEKRYDARELYQALNSFIGDKPVKVEGSIRRRINLFDKRDFIRVVSAGTLLLMLFGGGIIIKKRYDYKRSPYSTIDKIKRAQTQEEKKLFFKELETKLFDWTLERSKHLRKDMAAFAFNENKTVKYTSQNYQGFELIRDVYSLGFRETRNPEFLDLFTHFYDLLKFDKISQVHLDRFEIEYDMIKLLEEINFEKTAKFKDKMKEALQYLITERYNKKGKFFHYRDERNETGDKQYIYACTQYYTIPTLTEGLKIFDIKEAFGIQPSEYLDIILNQTRTSNKILVGEDYGVHFGAVYHILSRKPPVLFTKIKHSDKAYLSYEVIKYIGEGLYPVILLIDSIEKNKNITNPSNPLEKNVQELSSSYIEILKKEKEELTRTFFNILDSFREYKGEDGSVPYYMFREKEKLKKHIKFFEDTGFLPLSYFLNSIINYKSLPSEIQYFDFIISLLNNVDVFQYYLTPQKIEQLEKDQEIITKTLITKDNFNSTYKPASNQSFLSKMYWDINDPTIVSAVEPEKTLLRTLSKIK